MTKHILLLLATIALISCGSENDKFPLNKRYWEPMDYANVTRELKYGFEADDKLPSFDDPETRAIIEKYTDEANFNVILDDDQLGIKHRNKVAQDFFNRYRDMSTVYTATNRQDEYVYDQEMLAIEQFGLELQLKYFKLGNDDIIERSDDPTSANVQNTVNSNIQTLISNYNLYLDEINNENAFSEEGKKLFAKGIDTHFTKLVETYPNSNFSALERKIDLMYKKATSYPVKVSLQKLKQLIESKKPSE